MRTKRWWLGLLLLLGPMWAQAAVIPKVGTGGYHSIGLNSDGTVVDWGQDVNGQLGNGTTTLSYDYPVQVNNLTGVVAVAGGDFHTVALKSDGTVWEWGGNSFGQLGNGTRVTSSVPVQVSGLTDVIAIASGAARMTALRSDGTVWEWGLGVGDGPLGSVIPLQVSGLTGVIAITAGGYHTLALKSDGTLWAWGLNNFGQLGDNTNTSSDVPVRVSGLSNVVAVAGGEWHTLAMKSDGTVWAWGLNASGQLGNGTTTDSDVPVQVSNLSNVIAITGGPFHTVALKSDGTVWAWGSNGYGQLGNGTNNGSDIPVQVSGMSGIISIECGVWHTVALRSDGTVWAWGGGFYGQLGNGNNIDYNVPVQVVGEFGMGFLNLGPTIAFARFSPRVEIQRNHFNVTAIFTLGEESNGIDPVADGLTLKLDAYTLTIPPHDFREIGHPASRAEYQFIGRVDNTRVQAVITQAGPNRYHLTLNASGVDLRQLPRPLGVTLTIGDDTGTAT